MEKLKVWSGSLEAVPQVGGQMVEEGTFCSESNEKISRSSVQERNPDVVHLTERM